MNCYTILNRYIRTLGSHWHSYKGNDYPSLQGVLMHSNLNYTALLNQLDVMRLMP